MTWTTPVSAAPPDRPGAAGRRRRSRAAAARLGSAPAGPPFWFTIGGAADPGESLRDAGARELYEETRISVEPERLGEPIAQNSIEFSWAGHRIAQEQTFYAVAVGSVTVSLEGLDHWERATTDKYGWLTAEDLETDERPADVGIPDIIRAAVASVGARSHQARGIARPALSGVPPR